jgi:class 3 adenylate cyclase
VAVARKANILAAPDRIAMNATRGRIPAAPLVRTVPPFVGRAEFLSALESCLGDVCVGRSRFVLVRGVPGVGKTRLVTEFCTRARARGLRVRQGRSYEDARLPYLPFAEGLFAEIIAAAGRGELATLSGDVETIDRALYGGGPSGRGTPDTESDRLRLFLAVSRVTAAWARFVPAVLVFDDVQWIDRPSLELLAHLTVAIADQATRDPVPLLIVVVYRDDELSEQARRMVARLERDERSMVVDVPGLDEREVETLLQALGLTQPSRQLSARLAESTSGNPLFLQETVHYLRLRGALRTQGGSLVTAGGGPGDLRLPEDVGAAIAARRDGLGDPCRKLLTLMSFLAPIPSLSVLETLSGMPAGAVEAGIDEAVAQRLLHRDGDEVRFAHPMIRHVFYSAPSTLARSAIHLHIAAALQGMPEVSETDVLTIAHHLVSAGPSAAPAEVIDWAGRAAERAFSIFAWTEAGRFYEAALAAADRLAGDAALPDGARATLHLAAAVAHYRAADVGPCYDQFDRAVAAFTRAGDPVGRAQALVGKARAGFTLSSVPYGAMIDTEPLEASLAVLGDGHPRLRASIAQTLSEAYWHGRRPAHAERMGRTALALAEDLGDDRLCSEANHALALAATQELRVREALALWERSLELARRSGDPWMVAWPLPRLPLALFWLGEIERSQALVGEADAELRTIQDWAEYSVTVAHRACLAALHGDLASVERLADETLTLAAHSHYPWGGVSALPALACARAQRGAWDEALKAIELLVEPGRVFDEPGAAMQFTAWIYRLLIGALRGGDAPVTPETAASVVRALGPGPPDMGAVAALCALVEIADRHGDPVLAEPAVPGLTLAYEGGVRLSHGWPFSIPRILGVAAALRGERDPALHHLTEAVELAGRIDAQPELGRAWLDCARVLGSGGSSAQQREAETLLRRAHALAARLDMLPLAAECVSTAAGLSLELPPVPHGVERQDRTTVRRRALARRDVIPPSPSTTRRALLAAATPTRVTADALRVLMFTDMVGSTALLQELGDQRAQELLRAHNRMIRDQLARNGGTEIKHTGDGMLASFGGAAPAIECALAIQAAFATGDHLLAARPVRVRIGINAGQPLAEEGDLFGAAVNLAARICGRAEAGEVLVSDLVRQLAAGASVRFTRPRRLSLKGFPGRHRVYTVEWPQSSTS